MIYEGNKTKSISFPLGGIGTGSIGLAGNGSLVDWEIFNSPNKQSINGYTHFALRVKAHGKTQIKVLHGDTAENYSGGPHEIEWHSFGKGVHSETMAGYPHFRAVSFDATFPTAKLTFTEQDFPVTARLTAFNPFIPHDSFNSSLPVAMMEWELTSNCDQAADCALAFAIQNPNAKSVNKSICLGKFNGVALYPENMDATIPEYRDMSVLCDGEDVVTQTYWYRGRWKDAPTMYWKNLLGDRLPQRNYDQSGANDHATVAAYVTLKPGESKKIRYVIAWNAPVCEAKKYYSVCDVKQERVGRWKNYYATQFSDSTASAKYAMQNFTEFYCKTQSFADALAGSSMPDFVVDAVSANLSVLKTATCLRLEDGSFWGWEGINMRSGSCEGTCQHVWNYAYALPFLFPDLERSIRELSEKYSLGEDGKSSFRLILPLELNPWEFRACVDGQMGEIIKIYREWKISGDGKWLTDRAPAVFKMLEYAWSDANPDKWDADMDGVIEGRQHHTLDMELFGPNSWLEGFYLLALYCGAEIARFVGENDKASKYMELYEKGKDWTNRNLFNGEYFCQRVDVCDKSVLDRFDSADYWNDEAKEIKYQVAEGCIIDQVLADWHAALIGIPPVFDKDKKRSALYSISKYNYKNMRNYANMWRVYALNDEEGTIMCSYPEGAKMPIIPISYVDEVMTGFEYAVSGLMINEGLIEEGERAVKAIRDRYDGEKRNPWNEIECGNNYARSMASYALMNVYSGFTFDMTMGYIGFKPIVEGEASFVWSVANSWGRVSFTDKAVTLEVLGKPISLRALGLPADSVIGVSVDGKAINYAVDSGEITFDAVEIHDALTVTLE